MKGHLLDVNLLLALAWEDHVHHGAAHRWFAANHQSGWGTCAVTQLGFVRLSAHPKFSTEPVTPAVAIEALRQMVATQAGHLFFAEPRRGLLGGVRDTTAVDDVLAQALGHGAVTDAFLVLVARGNDGRLATFDRGVGRLFPAHVELISP